MNQTKQKIEIQYKAIEMSDIAFRIQADRENTKGLSNEGIESLWKIIYNTFPVKSINLKYRSECYDVAQFIVSKIIIELPLMSFTWYGRIKNEISDMLLKHFDGDEI